MRGRVFVASMLSAIVLEACSQSSTAAATAMPVSFVSKSLYTTYLQSVVNSTAAIKTIGAMSLTAYHRKLIESSNNDTFYLDGVAIANVRNDLEAMSKNLAVVEEKYPTMAQLWRVLKVNPQAQLSENEFKSAILPQTTKLGLDSESASSGDSSKSSSSSGGFVDLNSEANGNFANVNGAAQRRRLGDDDYDTIFSYISAGAPLGYLGAAWTDHVPAPHATTMTNGNDLIPTSPFGD